MMTYPLVGVKFQGKPSHVTDGIGTATAAEHGGKADKHGGFPARVGQDAGLGVLGNGGVELESAKGAGAAGMDNSLGDPLMVEAMDLRQSRQMSFACAVAMRFESRDFLTRQSTVVSGRISHTFSRPKGSSSNMGPIWSSRVTRSQSSVFDCLTP